MFLGTFSDNFESFEVFAFFKVFSKPRPSKVHWRLFFETKLPQNRFRTCLDNIGDSFGHFRNNEIFHFFQSFPYSTLQGAMCKIFTEKITSKHVQNMFDCFWERFLGILKKWKFSSFLKLFHVPTLKGALGLSFPKNLPQNKLKTSLDNFRNIFGHFWNSKTFSIFFSNFFQVSISRVPWARKEWAKKQLKSSLDISGNVFRDFESLKVYPFFEIFRILDPPGCTGRNFLPEKTPRSMLKTSLNTFGNVFGHFEKMKVFQFLKFFPGWTFQGALGNFFWEDYLKTSSKLVWTLLRTFWTLLRNQFFFDFSSNFYKIRSPGCTGQENFGKKYLKQVWTLLERFFGILELWNLFDFRGFFWVSCVHWAQRFPSKNSIKTISNNVFGNIFGQFWKFRSFCFF